MHLYHLFMVVVLCALTGSVTSQSTAAAQSPDPEPTVPNGGGGDPTNGGGADPTNGGGGQDPTVTNGGGADPTVTNGGGGQDPTNGGDVTTPSGASLLKASHVILLSLMSLLFLNMF